MWDVGCGMWDVGKMGFLRNCDFFLGKNFWGILGESSQYTLLDQQNRQQVKQFVLKHANSTPFKIHLNHLNFTFINPKPRTSG